MRKTILTLAISLTSYFLFAQVGYEYNWSYLNQGSWSDYGKSITIDEHGNNYTTGGFSSHIFGASVVSPVYFRTIAPTSADTLTSFNNSDDIYIQKRDANGNSIWIKHLGGNSEYERGLNIVSDQQGNIYNGGYFSGTSDFDADSVSTHYLYSNGGRDGYLQKLDTNGNLKWIVQLGGDSINDRVEKIIPTNNGNLYVLGSFNGTVDFDPGNGTNPVTVSQQSNYLLKLDTAGNFNWVVNFEAKAISGFYVDVNENIFLTGTFQNTVDFDPGSGIQNHTAAGGKDIFILKLNSAGSFQWVKQIGNSANEVANAITLDTTGNIYVTGYFTDTLDFDPDTGSFVVQPNYDSDAFILKLDNDGEFTWVKQIKSEDSYGSSNLPFQGKLIKIDPSGNLFIAGIMTYNSDFDPGNGTFHLTPTNATDHMVFLLSLDTNGSFLWAGGINGLYINNQALNDFEFDASGNCYLIGDKWNWLDVNPGSAIQNDTWLGEYDAQIVKYNVCYTTAVNDIITACDSATGTNGITYYNDTVFSEYIQAPNGCITSYSMDLTITGQSTAGIDAQTACDAYTWIDGNTYTANNNAATFILTNSVGCDSVVTLDLAIYSTTPSVDVHTACDTFIWVDGNTYSSSNNTATDTTFYPGGCYAVTTLDLTINSATSYTEVVSACDSYTWIDGNTYTTSNNTATYITTNASGCDSVITLDLTINSMSNTTDTHFACDTFTWVDGNSYITDNHSATEILTNTNGCDSVVTLDLTMGYTSYYLDVIDACNAYTWMDGNTYTANNSSATYTITNTSGCDSVISLLLTVNTINTGTTVSGSTISSNAGNANFQWLDCENNYAPIPGANGATYTAPSNGSYAVQIIQDNCTDTSECVTINNIGIIENNLPDQFTVYPNPTSGNVTIAFDKAQQHIALRLLGVNGQLIETKTMSTATQLNVEITGASGVYFIELMDDNNQKATIRVIKK